MDSGVSYDRSDALVDDWHWQFIVLDSSTKDPVSEPIQVQAQDLKNYISVRTIEEGPGTLIQIDGIGHGELEQVRLTWDGDSLRYASSLDLEGR